MQVVEVEYLEVRVFFHTSRHLLHEDLDESILADGAQVLNNVPVLQPLVQSDFLMKGLRVPAVGKQLHTDGTAQNRSVTRVKPQDRALDVDKDTAAVTRHHFFIFRNQ